MPEQVAASKLTQIGYEATAGTAVAATTKFHATEISMAMNPELSTLRPKGNRYTKAIIKNREFTKLSLGGKPDYNELTYVFESVFKKVSASGASTAKTRQIVPSTTAQDTHATFTVEQGDADRGWQAANGVISQFKMQMTRKDTSISGGGYAKAMADNFTMTPTGVTENEVALILPEQWSVYLADSWAGLSGASEMSRVFSAAVETPEIVSPIWPLKRSVNSFDGSVGKVLENMLFRLTTATDTEGMALLIAMRAGATKYLKLEAVGGLISTGVYYTLKISSPVGIKGVSDFKDHDGVYAIEWMLEAIDDGTNQFTIDLINKVATLA